MLKDGRSSPRRPRVQRASKDHLLFRSQLDAFVDVPNVIAQDKDLPAIIYSTDGGFARWAQRHKQRPRSRWHHGRGIPH